MAAMTFLEFARGHGIVIDHEPPVGVWKRYKTVDHPTKRNGAVKFLGDAGFVQNHATDTEVAVWKRDGATQALPQRDLADIRKREAKARGEAIYAMRAHFHSLPQLRGGHPYLTAKGLSMLGCTQLRVDGELLVVPMFDDGLRLMSYQTIAPDGEKKFRFGCPVKGASYVIPRQRALVHCYAEGLATGLAVFQSLPNATVAVCFNAGNMVEVARQQSSLPAHIRRDVLTVVLADNDWETALKPHMHGRNPGLETGHAAAQAIGCGIAYPSHIKGTDFADLLAERGERGPAEIRMQVMRYASIPEARPPG